MGWFSLPVANLLLHILLHLIQFGSDLLKQRCFSLQTAYCSTLYHIISFCSITLCSVVQTTQEKEGGRGINKQTYQQKFSFAGTWIALREADTFVFCHCYHDQRDPLVPELQFIKSCCIVLWRQSVSLMKKPAIVEMNGWCHCWGSLTPVSEVGSSLAQLGGLPGGAEAQPLLPPRAACAPATPRSREPNALGFQWVAFLIKGGVSVWRMGVNSKQGESAGHRDLVGAGSRLCSFRDASLGVVFLAASVSGWTQGESRGKKGSSCFLQYNPVAPVDVCSYPVLNFLSDTELGICSCLCPCDLILCIWA